MKNVFQQPADIIMDEKHNVMKVAFHSMSNPRSNRVLRELCDLMSKQSYAYPGTRMKLRFKAE